MNMEWSELHQRMQAQLKKKDTFRAGMDTLLLLRSQIMAVWASFRDELSRADYSAMPFPKAQGYHSKTIAYSMWHVYRIEDIVAHTLISGDEQVFFAGGWRERIHAPIITTGNELAGDQIADFSRQLDLDALYRYVSDVRESTEKILRDLPYERLKQKVPPERKEALRALQVVSPDESAVWLVDYWCGKDVCGLIRMPFSRHWIMHAEASLRIRGGIRK